MTGHHHFLKIPTPPIGGINKAALPRSTRDPLVQVNTHTHAQAIKGAAVVCVCARTKFVTIGFCWKLNPTGSDWESVFDL